MAVATDIINLNDIHPRNKKDVGHRLSLWALAKTYGWKDLVHSGPLYKSMVVEGNKIRILFDHTGSGFISCTDQLPESFAFMYAQSDIEDSAFTNSYLREPDEVGRRGCIEPG